jgi:uncharacterized protein (TIGR03435 family)
MLVMAAYDIKRYQLTAPGWFTTERFDITAKVPEGATKEQLKQMLQNLLAERFHMKIHRETKEMPVYELVVAKGGPKMTEAVEQPAAKSPAGDGAEAAPPPVAAPTRLTMGPDGCPLFPGSRAPSMMVRFAAKACLQASGETMEGFAATLANYLSKPVTDGTGLKGKYEFRLGWATDLAMERTAVPVGVGSPVSATPGQPGGSGTPPMSSSDGDSGPSLFGAVQKLGLKLEQKKGSVEMIVVDSADKAPTEN